MKRILATAFWKGTDPFLLARIEKADVNNNAVPIVQADVSTITYTVYNKLTGAVLSGPTGLTPVSTYILNTLNTGNIWSVDSTGFNFIWQSDRTLFTNSVTHRIPVTLLLVSGKAVVINFELMAANPAGD